MNQDFVHNFKHTLSKFSTGVTVVTTKYKNNHYGVTVNSFASLSLEPPLILFNLGDKSHSLDAFTESHSFNVNILSKSQVDIAKNFAKAADDKFSGITFSEDEQENAIFSDNIALLNCDFHSSHHIGDHYLIVGKVTNMQCREDLEPLIYFNSNFA
jgi:flavin reductase (DIM6/NTAB) family NADH-FMN oxidoreductase RutF